MNLSAVKKIVIHCSATVAGRDIGMKEIDSMHRHRNPPFRKIGYHRVIRLNGVIEYGRTYIEQGAGVRGHNRSTIHICYIGGLDVNRKPADTRTLQQRQAMAMVVREALAIFPGAEVLGHRDFSPDLNGDGTIDASERIKECPCFEVKDWWRLADAA